MRRVNSEGHRHLLQLIISKGALSENELQARLREFKDRYDNMERAKYQSLIVPKFQPVLTDNTLEQYVNTLNDQLREYYMRIEKIKFKMDNKFYVGIRNIDDTDDIGKITTDYEPEQIKYFELMLKEIRKSEMDGFELSEMDLYNVRPQKKSLSFAESTFKKLVRDKWLHLEKRERSNKVWFGVRTCVSLPHFLEADPEDEEEEEEDNEVGVRGGGDGDDDEFVPPPPPPESSNNDEEEEEEEVEGEE